MLARLRRTVKAVNFMMKMVDLTRVLLVDELFV